MSLNWKEISAWVHAAEEGTEEVRRTAFDGSGLGREIVAHLLGEQTLLDALTAVLNEEEGADMALEVLLFIRPKVVVDECVRILRDDASTHVDKAIFLLADIGSFDMRAFDLAAEFLEHPDSVVRVGAVALIEQAMFRVPVDPATLDSVLEIASSNEDPQVLERIEGILEIVEDARMTRLTADMRF